MSEEVLTLDSLGGLKVHSAGDIVPPERALVYGGPSCGKTPFVATGHLVRAFHPMLFICCDDGAKSVKTVHPGIKVVSPLTLVQLEKVIDALLAGKHATFKSICLDGASTVQYRGYEHLFGKNGRYGSFVDFDSPNWANHGYQASAQQMAIMVEKMKRLPCHVFFTAWAKNVAKVTRENPNPPDSWEPSFTPSASDAIVGRFDSILYLGKMDQNGTQVKYVRAKSNTKGGVHIMARDRGARLPEVIQSPNKAEDPTMQLLAKHWGLDHSLVE